ncbi:MAG: hypothetical protein ABIQ32_01945, partial [Sphingomicrobium sp.]
MTRKLLLACVAAVAISGCSTVGGESFGSGYYSLIRVKPTGVGDHSLIVTPPREWNRQRPRLFDDVGDVEDWTLNGPYLDGLTFVSGLSNNRALIRQNSFEDRQVPRFRSDMSAPEITSMIESLYRVRGGAVDVRTLSLQPRGFLGRNGFQWDYEHLDGDELWRKGRVVGAVVDGKLYMIMFDAARSHYYAN